MDDDGSKTYESPHRGARAFAEGFYAGIRNPGMHVPQDGGGNEQLALEQLAAFSLLARWVDQAELRTATCSIVPCCRAQEPRGQISRHVGKGGLKRFR
jgi:hypothetical protein